MTTFSPFSDETTRLPRLGADGRPLTRRQRRELERARDAADESRDPHDSGSAHASADAADAADRTGPDPAQGLRVRPAPVEIRPSGPAPAAGAHTPGPRAPDSGEVASTPDSAPPEPSASTQRGSDGGAEAAAAPPGPSEPSASSPCAAEPPASTGAQRAIGAALGRPRPRGSVAVVLAVLAAVAIVAVPLVVTHMAGGGSGRASTSGAASAGTVSADGPLDTVLEVAGRVGAVPVVSLKGSLTPATTISTDEVITGQGRSLRLGDAVLLSVATFSGANGTNTTGTGTGTRLYRGTLDSDALGSDLANAVSGVTEGSRIVLRAPLTTENGALTTEITVVDVLPTTATGSSQSPYDGMPSVTVNDDGTIAMSVQGLPAPTRSTAAVLVQGDGSQVQSESVVLARYAIVNWSDGEQRTSTYGTTTPPGIIDMSHTLAGIREHLVDAQVGSRVVISIPTDQAAGEGAVAVVVDVLAIADADELTDATVSPSPPSDASSGIVHVTPGATQ